LTADGLAANATRFSGFADLYDGARPTPPASLAPLLLSYAGVERAGLVVDLGSGTGLSTRWCAEWADHVVGVEPNADMRRTAQSRPLRTVEYVDGFSHATGLASGGADLALAVQALHWMEPDATFAEVHRILRGGGVFAAVDCDWPPSVGNARAEAAWAECRARCRRAEAEQLSDIRRWDKAGHLARMRDSGAFAWTGEVALHAIEPGDAHRFVDLLRSQGDLQTLLKRGVTEEELGVDACLRECLAAIGSGPRDIVFTYRVRIGVTGPAAPDGVTSRGGG
jgi:SAM-dependent methyltransferase